MDKKDFVYRVALATSKRVALVQDPDACWDIQEVVFKMAAKNQDGENLDEETASKKDKDRSVKIICLGDSAVGKSK